MKRVINYFVAGIILAGLSVTVYAQTADSPDFVSRELQIRGGLPNFMSKANKSNSLRIAYLGGSITEQNGWRIYSLEWFKQLFSKTEFIEINAAIGGTGSDLGAYRLEDQVLKFSPDLVFVEFCVNDNGVSPGRIIRSMEGIVRQIWKKDPTTDICFIYTIMEDYLAKEIAGNLPESVELMEQIADRYAIPSVNYGNEVCYQIHNKRLVFKGKSKEIAGIKVFSPDGVHPYPETGQMIYHEVLTRSLKKMIQSSAQQSRPHMLPFPIDPECFVNTRMVDISQLHLGEGWEVLPVKDNPLFSEFTKHLEKIGKATLGSKLNFRFKGTSFGVFDVIGPGSGKVEVMIDGTVVDTIMRFDAYCTYWRKHYFIIDQLEDTTHDITIRVLPGSFDKSLILSRLNRSMKDPDEYKEYNWYAGKILIDGICLSIRE
ncbi:SGNH/GDSL hydrolase family protein [Dysgonomonas termitidis]|uniref:SGNH/GDSL hydrolase family protein n=1 Tax=Dysgonomonas termitidis TaxID=1516126 RepID=A0ABV9L3E3_9BACT